MTAIFKWMLSSAIGWASSMWVAFTVSKMWVWFVTPAFGLVVPHFWILFGLILLARYMTYHLGYAEYRAIEQEPEGNKTLFVITLVNAISFSLMLGYGWIVHTFLV